MKLHDVGKKAKEVMGEPNKNEVYYPSIDVEKEDIGKDLKIGQSVHGQFSGKVTRLSQTKSRYSCTIEIRKLGVEGVVFQPKNLRKRQTKSRKNIKRDR